MIKFLLGGVISFKGGKTMQMNRSMRKPVSKRIATSKSQLGGQGWTYRTESFCLSDVINNRGGITLSTCVVLPVRALVSSEDSYHALTYPSPAARGCHFHHSPAVLPIPCCPGKGYPGRSVRRSSSCSCRKQRVELGWVGNVP